MKRAFFLIALAALSLGCERRRKLGAPSFILEVSPTATNVLSGQQKTFTARVLGQDGTVQDALPEWTLSTAALGTLSPQTGPEVTFTAGNNLGVFGTLQATHNGLTSSAQIWVGASPGNTATSYGFFSESTAQGIKLDIPNPSDPDGGFLGADGGGGGTILLETARGVREFTEGTKGLKTTVSGTAGSFAFFYISFGYPEPSNQSRDLSSFAGGTVKFDIRAPAGRLINLKLEWTGGNHSVPITAYTTFDNEFHSVSVPLADFTGINLAQFQTVTVAVDAPNAAGTFSFYIDNLRFERP